MWNGLWTGLCVVAGAARDGWRQHTALSWAHRRPLGQNSGLSGHALTQMEPRAYALHLLPIAELLQKHMDPKLNREDRDGHLTQAGT